MALFPPRACPHCRNPTITNPMDRRPDAPFTCPVCGSLVYAKFRGAYMAWLTVVVGMVPIIGAVAWTYISGTAAVAAMVAWFILAVLLPQRVWPLGVLKTELPLPSLTGTDVPSV